MSIADKQSGEGAPKGAERRKTGRVFLLADVTVRQRGKEVEGNVNLENVSLGGIQFLSDEPFPPGAILDVEVTSTEGTGDPAPMKAVLRVLRVENDEAPYKLAGEFLRLDLP